ncbi:unnamed protein product [Caretta caretta]
MESSSLEIDLLDTNEEGKLYVVDSLNNLNKLHLCSDGSQHLLNSPGGREHWQFDDMEQHKLPTFVLRHTDHYFDCQFGTCFICNILNNSHWQQDG